MTRLWIKVWVNECLDGTIRFDFTPEERGVWYDLLILAGRCRSEGLISAGKGTPYPRNWIAGTLNIPLALLERVLAKCEKTQRICLNGDGIQILNWKKYQSEYARQLQYREAKRERTQLYKKCPECHHSVPDTKAMERFELCPLCMKKGKEIKLVRS